MTKLSVNINKIATLRNSRGNDIPNLIRVAQDCEKFGAQGITIHPRPDERHIRYQDAIDLSKVVTTEFNIEGYPNQRFIDLILKLKPTQATLVPDPPEALTSSFGWDVIKHAAFLREVITEIKQAGTRVSLFIEPVVSQINAVPETGADRIELYTEAYAKNYQNDAAQAIKPYIEAAIQANRLNLGVNAGHDLSQINLSFFAKNIPDLLEVSIGHALISEALYDGLNMTIQNYLKLLV